MVRAGPTLALLVPGSGAAAGCDRSL